MLQKFLPLIMLSVSDLRHTKNRATFLITSREQHVKSTWNPCNLHKSICNPHIFVDFMCCSRGITVSFSFAFDLLICNALFTSFLLVFPLCLFLTLASFLILEKIFVSFSFTDNHISSYLVKKCFRNNTILNKLLSYIQLF